MSDVFISYGDENSDFAESLILHLKNEGIFVLERDTHSSPEKSYTSIEQAIRNASALLTIMTPSAKTSETVRYEWIFALCFCQVNCEPIFDRNSRQFQREAEKRRNENRTILHLKSEPPFAMSINDN